MRYVLAFLLRGYQLSLSFWLGRQCRFTPSCSEYTRQAILRFGTIKGGTLGLNRLARCHPWGGPGHGITFDPVPDSWQATPQITIASKGAPDEPL